MGKLRNQWNEWKEFDERGSERTNNIIHATTNKLSSALLGASWMNLLIDNYFVLKPDNCLVMPNRRVNEPPCRRKMMEGSALWWNHQIDAPFTLPMPRRSRFSAPENRENLSRKRKSLRRAFVSSGDWRRRRERENFEYFNHLLYAKFMNHSVRSSSSSSFDRKNLLTVSHPMNTKSRWNQKVERKYE